MAGLLRPFPLILLFATAIILNVVFQPLLELGQASRVQGECDEIAEFLSGDPSLGNLWMPEEISAHLQSKLPPRPNREADRSKDLWGSPYRIERSSTGLLVRSAGPDRDFYSLDDIFTRRTLTSRAPAATTATPPSK